MSILLVFFTCQSMAQKKMLIDINVGILNPIGNDEIRNFNANINSFTVGYFHKKKLKYPSVNLLAGITYPFTKKLSIGMQSGIYLRFKEEYYTQVKRTSAFIPIRLTAKYNLFTINNKWFGINASVGMLFFDFTDFERFHNSLLYNGTFSYELGEKSSIQLGIEKEVDKASIDLKKFDEEHMRNELFKYNLNRLFFHVSYSLIIKK